VNRIYGQHESAYAFVVLESPRAIHSNSGVTSVLHRAYLILGSSSVIGYKYLLLSNLAPRLATLVKYVTKSTSYSAPTMNSISHEAMCKVVKPCAIAHSEAHRDRTFSHRTSCNAYVVHLVSQELSEPFLQRLIVTCCQISAPLNSVIRIQCYRQAPHIKQSSTAVPHVLQDHCQVSGRTTHQSV